MTRIGSFEILRELHRTPHTLLYAARRAGDAADAKGRYALKVFDAESVGLLESVAAALTFLERAAVQKKIADQGAKHWAPVLEVGDVDTPYYVTELFPVTARRVVNRQAVVGERGLYTVVWSVVRGLTELRETYRRAHGNLKLTNVLIGGDESLASPKTTRVMLSDPSAEAASARDRSADLLAIGELIHQLVLRRPFKAAVPDDADLDPADASGDAAARSLLPPQWPVQPSATWDRLGPNGEQWLGLCNWLLSPAPADRPSDLVELAVALHRLTPQVRRFPARRVAAVLVPLVLAAGGVGGFWAVHANLRADLQAADQQWYAPLAAGLDDAGRRQRWALSDPALRDLTTAVAAAKAQGVRFDVGDEPLLSLGSYENAKAALAVTKRVAADLAPEQWAGLANLNALRQRYENRGWAQPAAYLGELTRGVRPGPGVDVAAGVDRLLDADARLRADAARLDEDWAKLDADLKSAEGPGDKTMTAFARRLRDAAALSQRLTDAGFDPAGVAALKDRLPLADGLAKLAAGGWPAGVDRARLADDVDARLNLGDPSDADVRKWLAAVDDYRLVTLDPAAEPLAGVTAGVRKLVEDVAKQPLDDAEQAAYHADYAKVQGMLSGLTGGRFVRKDVARGQGDWVLQASNVQKELAALRKRWVRVVDPETWFTSIDQVLATTSNVLKLRWKAYVDRQKEAVPLLAKDPDLFKRRTAQADAVRQALADLDQRFPLSNVAGFAEQFQSAVLAKREAELQTLSGWAAASADGDATPPAAEPFAAKVDERVQAFNAWCGLLRELTKDFPLDRELLTTADRPDRKWAARDEAFWADPVVRDLVKPDVDRIDALAAVATMARAELVTMARRADAAEVAWEAYRRLGEPPVAAGGGPAATAPATTAPSATASPAIAPAATRPAGATQPATGSDGGVVTWPATAQELADEVEARGRVGQKLRAVKSDADRARPLAAWTEQGPVRWRRFAARAVLARPGDSPAAVEVALRSAVGQQQAMGVTEAEVERLPAVARFNHALFLARATVEDAAAVGPDVDRRAAVVARAAAALGDRPDVRRLAGRLARLSTPEPMSTDARLLDPQPPDALAVVVGKGVELTFRRVNPPGRRPFYLSTTELSLRQFRELVSTRGDWTVANALLGNTAGPGGTAGSAGGPLAFRGPRLWDRPGSPDVPIDRFPDTWRFDGPAPDGRVADKRAFSFADPFVVNPFNRRSLNAEAGGVSRSAGGDSRIENGNPQYEHPMQQLTAHAALYAAALADCRLPTPAEWQAAYQLDQAAAGGSASAANPPNLRDKTWQTQVAYARREGLSTQWPDAAVSGVFWPKGTKPPAAGAAAVRDADDKVLFLRPVTAGGGTFVNLIGNVAEFLCDEPDAFDALPDRASAAAIVQFAKAYAGQLYVVGGSAFSAPELEPTKSYPLGGAAEPYADVGVRLAFTAPAKTTGERLKWYLDEQPYLAAPASATTAGKIGE